MEYVLIVVAIVIAVVIAAYKDVTKTLTQRSAAVAQHAGLHAVGVPMQAVGGLPDVSGDVLLTPTRDGLLVIRVEKDGGSDVPVVFDWRTCTFTLDTTERLYQRLGATRMLAIGVFSLAAPIRKEMVGYSMSVEGPHGFAVFSTPLMNADSNAGRNLSRIVLGLQSEIGRRRHAAESGEMTEAPPSKSGFPPAPNFMEHSIASPDGESEWDGQAWVPKAKDTKRDTQEIPRGGDA